MVESSNFDPAVILENDIVHLTIENCLEPGSGCFRNSYVFNDCGKISEYYPAMVATHLKSVYDEECKLIATYSISGDTIAYRYFYLPDDSVREEITSPHDTFFFQYKGIPPNYARRTEPKQYGTLHYPCATEVPGPLWAHYYYHDNGLISHVQIVDSTGKPQVDETYTYMRRDSSLINP